MRRLKLFAGIELDEPSRAACAAIAARLANAGVHARYEPVEKLHVTLAFLGWVQPEDVGGIQTALAGVARRQATFTISLDKLGAFPHERKPRVVWIGSRDRAESFAALATAVREAYAGLGFSFERAAVAHVTIARNAAAPLPAWEFSPVRVHVRHLTLFESMQAARTTRYEVLARAPLRERKS